MKIYIQPLQSSTHLHKTLADDGWKVETRRHGFLYASHPEVQDETEARSRLHRLGLLTSPTLRIEFHPPEKPRGPRGRRFAASV